MSVRWAIAVVLLSGPALGDERLAGLACRSVHLSYPAAPGSAFLNAVNVETSAPGTYFCVGGFHHGYLGIQEQDRGRKVAIFSVWDPGKQDDPKAVADERRVKLIAKDPETRVGRFGNEGTGGQSFLDLDWNPGKVQRFLVTAKPDGDRTVYAAYLAPPGADAWRLIAAFSTITGGEFLKGDYAFIEDFRRDRVSATRERRATFGPAWVRDAKTGEWAPLSRARFTADRNPSLAIDAGPTEDAGRFFLATGGKVTNAHTPLGERMTAAADPPRARDGSPEGYPPVPVDSPAPVR
jgi:hypothetical protein